jgi:hypothetical protein
MATIWFDPWEGLIASLESLRREVERNPIEGLDLRDAIEPLLDRDKQDNHTKRCPHCGEPLDG